MVTCGTGLVPVTFKMLKDLGRRDRPKIRLMMVVLDGLALVIQIMGLLVWPVATSNSIDKNFIWSFVLGLVLTSFGWWESYVDEQSVDMVSK